MPPRPRPDLRRRKPQRQAKKKFWLFCEGKNTEPSYFEALNDTYHSTVIEIEPVGAVGEPGRIARTAVAKATELGLHLKARRNLDSLEARDEVWAVFDRDEHPRFMAAVQKCEANNIGVARSNPCFEVWLILHYQDFHKPDDRHEVQKHLQKLCPEYDPKNGKTADCSALARSIHRDYIHQQADDILYFEAGPVLAPKDDRGF